MLRVVGEPRPIERAIKRLQGALKGVPSRGVRLTWRGGELRTTIHWARDDAFWWAVEPRGATVRAGARHAVLLGHAPDAPTKRESITCEINLPRSGADRRVAGIIAADEQGAFYLAHSGRMGGARTGQRKAGFRGFLADGVWRPVRWPDGEESEAGSEVRVVRIEGATAVVTGMAPPDAPPPGPSDAAGPRDRVD